jgi:Membrane bound O-acyl transferase family
MATCLLAGQLAANLAHPPQISLTAGIAIWLADLALVLLMALHPFTARLSLPVASFFFPTPIFLHASPFSRFALMVLMGVPFVITVASRFAPTKPGCGARLAFFFSWFGTKTIQPRARSLDFKSLLHFIIAAVVFALALAVLRTASPAGPSLLLRWLACGIAAFAFAETITASHDFITALLGLDAPALMRSPALSASVSEFWTRRWNVALSQLGFRPLFFAPVARHGPVLALFAAFAASAIAHTLVCFMALGRWPISLAFGAFFLVQPLLILAERALNVRRWPILPARIWTLTALAVTSPLFVEPMTQIVMPDLAAVPNVLGPTLGMLAVAIGLNLFVALGQLVFCVAKTD